MGIARGSGAEMCPAFAAPGLRDEGAAQHQDRADALQHSEFFVQHRHSEHHREGNLELDHRRRQVDAHELVGLVVAVAPEYEMHDSLAREPGEGCRRKHNQLA